MLPKTIIGVFVIAVLVASLLLLTVGGSILPSPGYRVKVEGTAYYDAITGWGVTYDGYTAYEDNWLPFVFWNDKVDVVVRLHGAAGRYTGSTLLTGYNPVLYEESFTVPVRWVKPGVYDGTIDIYQVVYDEMFGWFEQSRLKVGSTNINDLVVP